MHRFLFFLLFSLGFLLSGMFMSINVEARAAHYRRTNAIIILFN